MLAQVALHLDSERETSQVKAAELYFFFTWLVPLSESRCKGLQSVPKYMGVLSLAIPPPIQFVTCSLPVLAFLSFG